MNSQEAQKKWTVLASGWKDSGPPAAPSKHDVSHYVMNIPPGSSEILILGCTPALRNQLLSNRYRVISVDITRRMIDLTTPLVIQSQDDVVVQGNWLYLPFQDKTIDAVMGDKVIGNVMPDDWPILFAEIRRVLRPNGVFLTRASPHGENLLEPPPRQAFRDVVRKWVGLYKQGMKLESACSGLWEDCMDMSTVHSTEFSGTQQLIRVIPKTEEDCIFEADNDSDSIMLVQMFIRNYWPSREARWSAYTVQSILTAADNYLRYVGKYAASDYPEGDRQPVFHFVRQY